MGLAHALLAFREKAERDSIHGLEWKFPRANDGTICTFNVQEFALMDIPFRSADVLRTSPEWSPTLAWNAGRLSALCRRSRFAAKTRPWQAPSGISKVWIRSLPAETTTQLRAGIAIINAAIEGKVELVGTPCKRLLTDPHVLRKTGHRIVIESETLHDLKPVPFGGRDWLGPCRHADEYAEIGHAPHSVSFCDVRVERASLLNWLTTVSTKAPGLREADVTKLVLGEKEKNPFTSIDQIVKTVHSKDPLFPRDRIREIAREMGVKGRRGAPRKNSAE
jgi:hypothetical protein